MVISSTALRKLFLALSEDELVQLAQCWGLYEVPEGGWLENFELLSEQMQDRISARFAWESLSPNAREILHQMYTFEVIDGVPHADLQKLANLTDAAFSTALQELEQRLMLAEERPGTKAKARMQERGEKANSVLAIPKDFRNLLALIHHEIYSSTKDRSQMQLVEVLRTYDMSEIQEMAQLYDLHSYYYSMYNGSELAKILAGKLVQPSTVEYAWTRLHPETQKLCRWLCQQEGSAELALARTKLGMSDAVLSKSLRQLEDYGLVFDTFSGQKRKIFVGRGTHKVLQKLIEEFDQLISSGKLTATAMVVLENEPPMVRESQSLALYDLAIIIGATYQQIIEPTQAGYVPKRIANKISPLLHTSRIDAYGAGDVYVDILFRAARQLGLLNLLENAGQKPRFIPGEELSAWATLDPAKQVQKLLELWWNPSNYFWNDVAGANFRPSNAGFSIEMRTARKVLTQYILDHCEPGRWFNLKAFLETIKKTNHLLLHPKPRYTFFETSTAQTRRAILAQWDQTDGEIITGLIASSLYEFGLVSLGYEQAFSKEAPVNPMAFKLSDLATKVFQLQKTPAANPVPSTETKRSLIVQPNFELLLLQPDYAALYQLLPFAKVTQVEMVSRLTLTQESIRRGVEAGWSVERIQQTLQNLNQKELPQNVLYTLQDWGRLYKDVTVSQILLLEVSNETIADEICASAKFRSLDLRRLGPRAIAAGSQNSLQILRSTLEKEGVIVRIQGNILNARDSSATVSTYYGRPR
jgi:hypothetical protein